MRKISDFLVEPKLISTKLTPKAKRRPKQAKKISPGKNQPKITKFTNSNQKTQLNPAQLIEGNEGNTLGNLKDLTGTQGQSYLYLRSQISESVTETKDTTEYLNLLKRTEDNIQEPNKGDSKGYQDQLKGLQDREDPLVKLE